jgi:paraquat-inducible protein A
MQPVEHGDLATAPAHESWRECPHCGLVSALPAPKPLHVVYCPRCDLALWRMRRVSFNFPIACGLAAFFFYMSALAAPFLEITSYGRFQLARITTGPTQLTEQGYGSVALLVFAVTMIFPGIKLAILLLTLIGIETHFLPNRLLKALFRWYVPISPWAMIDVYLLGFLVAYTRLTVMASVHLDTALFSLIGFMISIAAADGSLDHEAAWRALDHNATHGPHAHILHAHALHAAHATPPAAPNPADPLISCSACGLLNQALPGTPCRRCHGTLHPRKTDSIRRTWAFLIAAVLLYIPANIYPVMTITQLDRTYPYTIMGGIVELVNYNLWPLALLVFFASITIPLMKLLILGYMLLQTQKGSTLHLVGRTRAFRIIDFIGRWSMIDVFMISILVALVRFNQFADVRAQPGVSCFAAVVVLTIFAVNTFDPRLMWDVPAEQTAKATQGQRTA